MNTARPILEDGLRWIRTGAADGAGRFGRTRHASARGTRRPERH